MGHLMLYINCYYHMIFVHGNESCRALTSVTIVNNILHSVKLMLPRAWIRFCIVLLLYVFSTSLLFISVLHCICIYLRVRFGINIVILVTETMGIPVVEHVLKRSMDAP